MDKARRSSRSFALLSNSLMLYYYSDQVSVSSVSGSLLPVHLAELATKKYKKWPKRKKNNFMHDLFFPLKYLRLLQRV